VVERKACGRRDEMRSRSAVAASCGEARDRRVGGEIFS
jgi:hypothetical protein